ncbi:SusD/RagB family nutrient-binding outer membrane lipoprotein [Cellulophaga sp. 20_2_10]|uniref:SusD/RagB family nutrient-binding outer membrane lipoprotein n=1 Tax=Cellulophaga sp. 20_2_10 TaxID=2942476 RepID=UPI00201A2F6A|nr:SusD/RagB family nutrient-binding outer membrane lipoprotein [Cellulophaga sp. 20_2_10]MCL5245067.1 SusD/RagB family nutrient-binding outer membrane lipoprotein [Cellulophaga sp. 20_2_10]
MKNKLILLLVLVIATTFNSCDKDLAEINANPNNPEVVPTNNIFASATKQFTDFSRDAFNEGRLTLPWVQYWGQTAYADEDRYLYRETSAESIYRNTYLVATDFKAILDQNTNEESRGLAAAYGDNDNQIAASRIMLSYMFYELTNFFGDVPYYSYGSDNETFQALNLDLTPTPVFAAQEDIYADILKELRESADMINVGSASFVSGDNVFGGDAEKWKKFANSLILRVATTIKDVDATTYQSAFDAAIASGVMTSNDDNASQAYEAADANSSPLWGAFISRTDFAVAAPFVELLKGERGNFNPDPRLFKMAVPISVGISEVKSGTAVVTEDYDDYLGVPYAFRNTNFLRNIAYSYPSSNVLKPDYREVFMEYAEVEFLISERNNWSQANYENGVTASMEKWGVDPADVTAFVSGLPAANQANVLNQKYIALYMQAHQAYTEYRRTGFPNTLVKPNDVISLPQTQVDEQNTDTPLTSYTFEPGPVDPSVNDLPFRLRYPQILQTLNGANRAAAASDLSNGDLITSKLFWDLN